NTLGRHPNNSVQLLDKIVSKEHCIIVQSGNDFILQDLGSLNGTFINGERVAGERLLRDGDEIALGSTRALFHLATDDPAQASNPPLPGVTRPWDRDVFHPAVAHVEQVPSAPASIAGVTTEPLRKPLTSANTASQ